MYQSWVKGSKQAYRLYTWPFFKILFIWNDFHKTIWQNKTHFNTILTTNLYDKSQTKVPYRLVMYGTFYIDNIQKAVIICLIIPTIFPSDFGSRAKYPTDLYGTIYIDNIQKAVVICLIIPTIFPFDAGSSITKIPGCMTYVVYPVLHQWSLLGFETFAKMNYLMASGKVHEGKERRSVTPRT
jgi:hypothetical protein